MANDPTFNEMEGDLQAELERAASLTAELGREVGAEPPPPGPRESEFFESTTDSEASLDAQMAQVGEAVESTASELGTAPVPASPAPASLEAEAPQSSPPPKKAINLPPKKAAAAEAPLSAQAAGKSASTAGGPTKTIVLPGKSEPSDGSDTWKDHSPNLVAGAVPQQPFPVDGDDLAGANQVPMATGALGRALHGAATVLCSVLDLFDRPFASIGYSVRWWLGWVALALGGLAIFLLVFAVL